MQTLICHHTALMGSSELNGLGRFILLSLCRVNEAKHTTDTTIPTAERGVMETPNTTDVTTIAKRRRMQLRAAWCTTEMRLSMYVEARL
mmetsp:Transcript_37379/g.112003  ORF Transcript_37379/g.112003 Transcript_37379/m.112003 type:complete len:89 (-) Transcript_37379:437-703(-)